MSFIASVKAEMFIRSARLCCLCLKQCGTNIEAAHIVDKHAGGGNGVDNGIPLCLDCHQEIGGYDDAHPRGNKFTVKELTARRDKVYELVESGAMHAMIFAVRAHAAPRVGGLAPLVEETLKPSSEAKQLLETLLQQGPTNALGRKLGLFSTSDKAFIIDSLINKVTETFAAISVVGQLLADAVTSDAEKVVIAERALRRITLLGGVGSKWIMLRDFPEEVLASIAEPLREAAVEEIIGIINTDNFNEVNDLVPAMVQRHAIVPKSLAASYVLALIKQGESSSYKGSPAAKRGLATLPPGFAEAALGAMDVDFLQWQGRRDTGKAFILANAGDAPPQAKALINDFVTLTHSQFVNKHVKD